MDVLDYEIALTPTGRLRLVAGQANETGKSTTGAWMRRVADGFSSSRATGLCALASTTPDGPLSPSLSFWRDFACRYLTRLCRTPESAGEDIDPIGPPVPEETATVLFAAPLMQGGEYLSAALLGEIWADLDEWMRKDIASFGGGLSGWLKQHAALWHQVGRVCFHLAENKRDPEFPFAFLATYAPGLSKGGRVQYQPLGRALQEHAGHRNKQALINLLSPVHRASEKSRFIKELVDSGEVFHPLPWNPEDAYRFLRDIPVLEESGLLVRVPDWWQKRPRPRVVLTLGEKRAGRLTAETMLDCKIELALGEQELTAEEWRQIMEAKDGLVNLKGQWVEVDRERLSQALAQWKRVKSEAGERGISFIEGMRLLAGAPADLGGEEAGREGDREWAFVNAGTWLSEVLSGLRDPATLASGRQNRGFRGTLRPYQAIGRDWLRFLSSLGLGACLADDMGLGKTVQILALLVNLQPAKKEGAHPSLLVLPASLLSNWKDEMKRFAPSLKACFVHPSETGQGEIEAMAADPERAFLGKDVVLTTYGMLLRQKWLIDREWRLVILDEAQAIKNPGAGQTRAVKKLHGEARIVLTGTPVENRLSDLWSLFDFLSPGLLGSAGRFKDFVKGLERREQERYAPLRHLVRPYILRRLKTDKAIIADLPDKTEMKTHCGLTQKQAALYLRSVEELSRALQGQDGMKRRGLVLAYLLRFKQICNHPSQLLGDGLYGPADSGKFNRLRDLGEEIASRQERALVFTQFREMTEPLASFLGEIFGREGLVLHGGTPVRTRKALIDAFAREDGPPFFVLSLKAGGTGLNLTSASHVIHFDRWWNPAVENQATDRAFRIGQKRNVVVHKFITRGTVEEKIDALIEEKSELADGILKAGAETLLTEMGDKELLDLVALNIDRACLEERER
jgi:superfamily II DNA or RNA helicase